jgi:dihydrofolate reductase
VTTDSNGTHGRQTGQRPIQFVHVAAVAENGVIGRAGTLPWRLKSDMQHFRCLTMGKPLVMGRRTYLSLSRKPLPGRTNVVVSRDRTFAAPGVVVAATLDAALAVARGDALRRGGDEIMVIGGSDVFRQTMAMADRLEITLVHMRPQGDSAFPPIDPQVWQEISRREQAAGPNDEASFTFLVYRRRPV